MVKKDVKKIKYNIIRLIGDGLFMSLIMLCVVNITPTNPLTFFEKILLIVFGIIFYYSIDMNHNTTDFIKNKNYKKFVTEWLKIIALIMIGIIIAMPALFKFSFWDKFSLFFMITFIYNLTTWEQLCRAKMCSED